MEDQQRMEGQCNERVEELKDEDLKDREKWRRLVHSWSIPRGDMATEEDYRWRFKSFKMCGLNSQCVALTQKVALQSANI